MYEILKPSITNFVILLVLLIAIVALYIFTVKSKENRIDYDESIYKRGAKKKKQSNMQFWVRIYNNLATTPGIDNKIKSVFRKYNIITPLEKNVAKAKAAQLFLMIVGINVVMIVTLLVLQMDFYVNLLFLVLIVVFDTRFVKNSIAKEQRKILTAFMGFCADVRFHYFDSGMIDEAIFNAIESCHKIMKPHAEKFYEILNADDVREAVQEYNRIAPNIYMKQFIALAVITHQNGARLIEGEDSLLYGLKNVIEETGIKLLELNSIKQAFEAMTIIAIVPVFVADFVKSFSISTLPASSEFYNSTTGVLVLLLVFSVSIGIFALINKFKDEIRDASVEHPVVTKICNIPRVKEALNNYTQTHPKKIRQLFLKLRNVGENFTPQEYMVRSMLFFVAAAIIGSLVMTQVHNNAKQSLTENAAGLTDLFSGATSSDTTEAVNSVIYYTNKFKDYTVIDDDGNVSKTSNLFGGPTTTDFSTMTGALFTDDGNAVLSNGSVNSTTLIQFLNCDKKIKSDSVKKIAATKIIERIEKYHKEYFKWYEFVFVLLVAFGISKIPDVSIMFDTARLKRKMQDEVMQFQTIIIILASVDSMTLDDILEWLEEFAVIFKDSITVCVNKLSEGDIEALEMLQEMEPFSPFCRLIDSLKMVDRIGVKKAFSGASVERKNYQDTRRQEVSTEIANQSAMSSLLIMVPTLVVLMGYCVVPMMGAAFNSMNDATANLE